MRRHPPGNSLREREGDISLLAESFMERYSRQNDKTVKLDPEGIEVLQEYDWPGNVRQLRNFCERLAIISDRPLISRAMLTAQLSGAHAGDGSRKRGCLLCGSSHEAGSWGHDTGGGELFGTRAAGNHGPVFALSRKPSENRRCTGVYESDALAKDQEVWHLSHHEFVEKSRVPLSPNENFLSPKTMLQLGEKGRS